MNDDVHDPDNCQTCQDDYAFLRQEARLDLDAPSGHLIAAELFAGCGGMSLGLMEAARRRRFAVEFRLAVDNDQRAAAVYRTNIVAANVVAADVGLFFDGRLGSVPTLHERMVAEYVGTCDFLLGGPPCQGHSDLNNHTRRDDPRNSLYASMARAAEVLLPTYVVIENVPAVARDVQDVVATTTRALRDAGYDVAAGILRGNKVGVPQSRARHVLLAARDVVVPQAVIDSLQRIDHLRTVSWAIEDLGHAANGSPYDQAAQPTSTNQERIDFLFDNGLYDLPNEQRPACHQKQHSYGSVYGRMKWDAPAPTITTGFRCMGQGRFVHPAERRTITPHEAARLQTFPDWFSFTDVSPTSVARMIGNAVPPLMLVPLYDILIGRLASQAHDE